MRRKCVMDGVYLMASVEPVDSIGINESHYYLIQDQNVKICRAQYSSSPKEEGYSPTIYHCLIMIGWCYPQRGAWPNLYGCFMQNLPIIVSYHQPSKCTCQKKHWRVGPLQAHFPAFHPKIEFLPVRETLNLKGLHHGWRAKIFDQNIKI